MRYSLRTLLILMLLTGPMSLFAWQKYVAWHEAREKAHAQRIRDELLQRERATALLAVLTQQNTTYITASGPLKEKAEPQERLRLDEVQDLPE